ncbi:DMT family transporter [Cognatishimia sp. F0-27]|uniref:DMT family transporter n=1 Tax=Cognatishimia sp. F0-27 TaxID=2816855 RepID=UPI001D0C87F4|nr:DMT family transporter [Cognatishimia sp. F0-27]MCC1493586.1 DMT family transporter [Cognatishimia sp. F0-27]
MTPLRDADRPLLGLTLMLGFCILAPFGDALAKMLGGTLPTGQLVLLRFAFQAAILVPIMVLSRRRWQMSPRAWRFTALRTVFHILGITLMFTSLIYLPLADAIAIAFVMPFILLLLGYWLLAEEVGWRRIAACAVGFTGTLLVIQPAFEDVGWPALLPLGVAFLFAGFMLSTRVIAREVDPIGMQAISALMATAILLPMVFLAPRSFDALLAWQSPDGAQWRLIAAMGLAGTLAHLLMTWSLRFAPASTLAPVQYLEIPVATVIGYLLFADLPNPLASLGIMITVGAGLYIILRERAIAAHLARPSQAPPGKTPAG